MMEFAIAIGLNALKFVLDKPLTTIIIIVIAYGVYRLTKSITKEEDE